MFSGVLYGIVYGDYVTKSSILNVKGYLRYKTIFFCNKVALDV